MKKNFIMGFGLAVCLFIITGGVIVIAGADQFNKEKIEHPVSVTPPPNKNIGYVPAPTVFDEVTEIDTRKLQKKAVEFRKKLANGEYEIITATDNRRAPFTQWQDWVIYGEASEKRVYAFNLKTEEKVIIMDLTKDAPELNEYFALNELIVIDNDLYLFFGEYMMPGGSYWTKLPPGNDNNILQKMFDKRSPDMFYENDKYWLVAGWGDACMGYQTFNSFNPKTKETGPDINFNFECGDGDMYIGMTKTDQFLGGRQVDPDANGIGYYVEIYSINPQTGQKTILLSEKALPENIENIKLNKADNELLLFDNSPDSKSYIYKINSDEMVEYQPGELTNEELSKFIYPYGYNNINNELNLPDNYEITQVKM